jgi:hypothetical protein
MLEEKILMQGLDNCQMLLDGLDIFDLNVLSVPATPASVFGKRCYLQYCIHEGGPARKSMSLLPKFVIVSDSTLRNCVNSYRNRLTIKHG